MPIDETTDFRTKYQSFLKWTKYMRESMKKVDAKKFKDKWLPKFIKDVCEPLDNAWQKLTDAEQNTFAPEDTGIEGITERRVKTGNGDELTPF